MSLNASAQSGGNYQITQSVIASAAGDNRRRRFLARQHNRAGAEQKLL
jgi:hypothetical protein